MKKITCLIISLMCFSFAGLSQNIKDVPNIRKLQYEILEKRNTTDSVIFMDLSLQAVNGKLTGGTLIKKTKTPKKGYVFVIAKIKLTYTGKKAFTLYPTKNLIAKNQNGIKNTIDVCDNPDEPNTYRYGHLTNNAFNLINYSIKRNESVIIKIVVELPENSSQLLIEYKK